MWSFLAKFAGWSCRDFFRLGNGCWPNYVKLTSSSGSSVRNNRMGGVLAIVESSSNLPHPVPPPFRANRLAPVWEIKTSLCFVRRNVGPTKTIFVCATMIVKQFCAISAPAKCGVFWDNNVLAQKRRVTISGKMFRRHVRNVAEICFFFAVFVLLFPAKVAARNFTKNPPQRHETIFFQREPLGADGPNNFNYDRTERLLWTCESWLFCHLPLLCLDMSIAAGRRRVASSSPMSASLSQRLHRLLALGPSTLVLLPPWLLVFPGLNLNNGLTSTSQKGTDSDDTREPVSGSCVLLLALEL